MGKAKIKFDQVGIFVLGATAIYLVGLENSNPLQRWGYIIGVLSQPFWIYSSYINRQWGILFLSIFYTYSWGMGAINRF